VLGANNSAAALLPGPSDAVAVSACEYPARHALTRRGLIVSNSRHDTLQDRMTMVTTSCFVLLDVGP
jgi:hypothetical protein